MIFSIVWANSQAQKDTLFIQSNRLDTSIHTISKILIDSSESLSFTQIQTPKYQSQFTNNQRDNFGFNAPVIWLKIVIKNQTSEHFFLVLDLKTIDRLNFYEVLPNGQFKVVHTGSQYAFNSRNILVNGFIFDLKIPQNQTYTYYLRLDSERSLRLPLRVLSAGKLLEQRFKVDFLQGLFVGILSLVTFFSIFLFFASGNKAFFWYIFYVLAFMVVIANQTGYAEGFLWSNFPQLNRYVGAMVAISNILHWAFFFTYLQTAQRIPWIHRLSYILVLLPFFICGGASLLGYVGESILWINNVTLLAIVYSTFTLWQIKLKYRVSRFFTIAILFLWTFMLIHIFYLFGYLPVNLITANSIILGGLGEAIFFAFALADQMNLFRKENEKIQAENLHLIQTQNQNLEIKIKERTLELQQLNEELKFQSESLAQINQTKDKLFSVISHDFRSPLNSMKGALRLLQGGHLSEDELKFLADALEEKVNVTSILLDNLLFWAKNQMEGLVIQPEDFDLKDLADEQFNLFKFQAQEKRVQLIQEIADEFWVFADPNCIRLIIRNLIANSIKFCQVGDSIKISAWQEKNQAIVAIADTGVGIEAEKLPYLFDQPLSTAGTAQEKGTGLGLLLCKDFIEKNHGKIWVESQLEAGSTFYFSLPLDESLTNS